MLEFISQPWHWSISGALIALSMFFLIYFGERFGVSSSLRHLCAIGGAGSKFEYFNYDWKAQRWNLAFVAGSILGGFLAIQFLSSPQPVNISEDTINYLETVGIHTPQTLVEGNGYVPVEIFNFTSLWTPKGFMMLIVGGFFIGFGTRWAGGCTSGHAISGLSNLQLPSLVAVIGFFAGGLITTWFLLPYILSW